MNQAAIDKNRTQLLAAIREALNNVNDESWISVNLISAKLPHVLAALDNMNVNSPNEAELISGYWLGVLNRGESVPIPREHIEISVAMILGAKRAIGGRMDDIPKSFFSLIITVMIGSFINGDRWTGAEWEKVAEEAYGEIVPVNEY